MPPSVAMNSKAPLPPGMAGLANNRVVIPKPDDQLHAVRAGRKSYADAKITLQSPVARAIIALKAFTPEYLQVTNALAYASFICFANLFCAGCTQFIVQCSTVSCQCMSTMTESRSEALNKAVDLAP